ncbi:hypothetical protein SRABI128_06464 [Microbacterium sp. Bi128]|nr:hypothetical protein SRABI128_06464 [Microbacterium sp. Bi128]
MPACLRGAGGSLFVGRVCGIGVLQDRRGCRQGGDPLFEGRLAGAQLVQGGFEGLCLFVDFGDRRLRLHDAGGGVGLRPLCVGDHRFEFCHPGPARSKVRGSADGVISPFPGQGCLLTGFPGRCVAALGGQDGDVLLGLGELTT